MRRKHFYQRQKIRLSDLRSVRTEMCVAYRAATRQEIQWQDLRAAIAALSAIAQIDQGIGADARLAELEEKIAAFKARSNGHEHPNGVGRPLPLREIRP